MLKTKFPKTIAVFLFDLVIIDRMMPSGDGIDLIKIIKEKNNIPIIMLTAMSESENRIQGLQYGADDYLSKPFEPEELYLRIKKLKKILNNRTLLKRFEEKVTS